MLPLRCGHGHSRFRQNNHHNAIAIRDEASFAWSLASSSPLSHGQKAGCHRIGCTNGPQLPDPCKPYQRVWGTKPCPDRTSYSVIARKSKSNKTRIKILVHGLYLLFTMIGWLCGSCDWLRNYLEWYQTAQASLRQHLSGGLYCMTRCLGIASASVIHPLFLPEVPGMNILNLSHQVGFQ